MHVISPRPANLHHDHETFCVLNLPDVGLDRYARHPSSEILMTSFAYDEDPVEQWVPEEGEPIPAKLEDGLLDERIIKHAWNAQFERFIWRHCWGIDIPIQQWRDTMVLAMSVSFPGKLSKAGEALRLDDEHLKMTDGKTLMNWFSKLRPATKLKPIRRVYWHEQPEKWEKYKLYNRRDTETERTIYQKLKDFDLPEHEWELWHEDQEINEAGIPINFEFAAHCEEVVADLIEARVSEMTRLTGLQNGNAPQQLLPWCQDRGYPFDDLKKGHVRRAIEMLAPDEIGYIENKELVDVLELRLQAAQAAVKKYAALVSNADDSANVLRNTLQFCGAQRTWRWAGRVFQAQNLASPVWYLAGLEKEKQDGVTQIVGGDLIKCRNTVASLDAQQLDLLYKNPMDMLSASVRPTIEAPEGYLLVDADLSAIENVVLGWLANDRKILRVFENGLDPYIDFGTYLFKQSYADLWHEYDVEGDGRKRKTAKPGVLGCGYMLGAGREYEDRKTGEIEATGLLGYAWGMGVKEFTLEQAELSVAVWRQTYSDAVRFWDEIQSAAFRTVNTRRESAVRHIGFDMKRGVLRMHLPSGRCLHYIKPRIIDKMMPWGKTKPNLTYEGKDHNGNWNRISTHPGKLTENADQATARDLLAHGIRNARREGIDVRLHVHDQIVGLALAERARHELKVLIECMTDRPAWAPDMPISAAGHISKWFVKD